jgi:hypothetical protein
MSDIIEAERQYLLETLLQTDRRSAVLSVWRPDEQS